MHQEQTKNELSTLVAEIENDLTGNILPFWMNKVKDPDGGYYGAVGNDGKAIPKAPKGSILNGRILWTFSRAFRQYGLDSYRKSADRAAEYYINHFIDKEYGGAVWSVDSEGKILDGTKQCYATAFGIYGMAEHFRATGDRASLNAAVSMYRSLEDHSHDKVRKGYIEAFNRDWSEFGGMGVDKKAGATKTMNTHLHILEAYTTLYRVWPDEELRSNLTELVSIFQSHLYDREGRHLVLYCTGNWDSLEEVQSFGHDIEASWLLTEAAEVLGDEELIKAIQRQALEMTEEAIAGGLRPDGAMQYERTEQGIRESVSWWCQCETIIGCINAWQIGGDTKFIGTAQKTWDFIKSHFIDYENGDWFKNLTKEGLPAPDVKVGEWNCPYHSSRISFELRERLSLSIFAI